MTRAATSPVRSGRHQALGAVAAQFMQAAASLLVLAIAARILTGGGFGTFALLYSALLVASAVHTGLVGDSLTVLERDDPAVAWGLRVLCAVSALGACLVAAVGAAVGGLLTAGPAALFGCLVAVWLLEETLRRLLMADMRFWMVVLIDATALTTAVATILLVPGDHVTRVLVALLAGQTLATLAALRLLPKAEWQPVPRVPGGVRSVLDVGLWRALQAGMRPSVLLLLRMVVAIVATRAALGSLEAARLLVAPAVLLVGGVGTFLLPSLTTVEKRDPADAERRVRSLSALLIAGTAVMGSVAVVLARPLGHALTGGHFPVTALGVAAWATVATTLAATMPWDGLGAVRRAARQVFLVRVFEGALALTLVVIALGVLDLPVEAGPFAVSAAGVFGLFILRRVATRAVTWQPAVDGS